MTQCAKSWLAYSMGRRSKYVNISGYPLCIRLLVHETRRCNFWRAISSGFISTPDWRALTISYVVKVLGTVDIEMKRRVFTSGHVISKLHVHVRPLSIGTTLQSESLVLYSGLLPHKSFFPPSCTFSNTRESTQHKVRRSNYNPSDRNVWRRRQI